MSLLSLKAAAASIALLTGTAALAQHEGHEMPMPEHEEKPEQLPDPHAGHDMSAMDESEMALMPGMAGALGPYSMTREASGTAWQPDSAQHGGIHLQSGKWG